MATNEERVIDGKLKTLRKAIHRNEELMQEAAIAYEGLIAEKKTLQLTMEDLKKSRTELKRKKNGSS